MTNTELGKLTTRLVDNWMQSRDLEYCECGKLAEDCSDWNQDEPGHGYTISVVGFTTATATIITEKISPPPLPPDQ